MFSMDAKTYRELPQPLPSAAGFVKGVVSSLNWKVDGADVMMDVGCGPGTVASQLIIPLFPGLQRLIAVDLLSGMIKQANEHNFHPRIEYHVASISDWATVQQWKGRITKLISIHCFNWLKDQRDGFLNVHRLLKSGGEAAVCFVLQSAYYDAVLEIAKLPKWETYFKRIDLHVPESHYKEYDSAHYKKMLEEIGFTVLMCNKNITLDTFESEEDYAGFYTSICVLVSHVPPSERPEFKSDFIDQLQKLNERNSEGFQTNKLNILEVVVKKN